MARRPPSESELVRVKRKTAVSGDAPPDLSFRALGYKDEEGGWVVHCLETDLVGEGRTREEAFLRLVELTNMQIGFAIHKKNLKLIYHPAPTYILEKFHEVYVRALTSRKTAKDAVAKFFPVPKPEEETFCVSNG